MEVGLADYNLDALGWYQFERLVQTLLKAHLSAAIEAWSGSGDHGRDAWYSGKLRFPDRDALSDGPFLFQMKFVANANAAGANPAGPVLKAVKAESARIGTRASSRKWIPPSHYIFITNAPLTPGLREKIRAELSSSLHASDVTTWGASDLDGLLDDSPRIRTSYPQIMGIRDLHSLLSKAVNADVIERSQIELALSTDLAKVFVPTQAYRAAYALLGHRNFVVLTGPPEVGKTAIARIIALARLTQGWEAYECVDPANLFALHDRSRSQIFVADDAFGSTEYRPSIADAWARDMQRILATVDRRHWVVFTSRPAPLSEALRMLNFQGSARHFPEPARVTVDASALSRTERALILYRHAKAASLGADLLAFIREKAPEIVESHQFTPLRAHRLVNDDLPAISRRPGDEWGMALAHAVERGLREPTRAMQTSFNALPLDHRRALVAMLDASAGNATLGELLQAMERRRPHDARINPTDVVKSLDEHFVRIRGSQWW